MSNIATNKSRHFRRLKSNTGAIPRLPNILVQVQTQPTPGTSQTNTHEAQRNVSIAPMPSTSNIDTPAGMEGVNNESGSDVDEPSDVMLIGQDREPQLSEEEQLIRRLAMQVTQEVVKQMKKKPKNDE